jgi:deoxyribose-phosphate aldolase
MEICSFIDHTVLRPNCTRGEVQHLCAQAVQHQFKAVCLPPYFVRDARHWLEKSPVRLATVIGFPFGYSTTPAKVEEMKRAFDDGAQELDVVINLCAVKDANWAYVKNDIDSMTRAAHLRGCIVKVILETSLLTEAEIDRLCAICAEVECDFVKTSTGFHGDVASPQTIRHLRAQLPPNVRLKASGGIRTLAQAQELIQAGADRIGTSSGLNIIGVTA